MDKKYYIRIYIYSEEIGLIVNDAIDVGMIVLTQSFDGADGCLAIYDGKISSRGLKLLVALNIPYFPLNHYEDFVITCPHCGERIDDDMIMTIYDKALLSGYNILCNRHGCGCRRAKVEYIEE